jgi:hypothetical protein
MENVLIYSNVYSDDLESNAKTLYFLSCRGLQTSEQSHQRFTSLDAPFSYCNFLATCSEGLGCGYSLPIVNNEVLI